ncbi:predicted protein [Streptomyces viridosporus ATCC 14672]|uniref:Predicted protein n=1 Tax=Streptomyces viridosporus (strain ATCC 14672 / DSM 40746 / JCM 4963 / KCTC 9882 / NRRL B-12104 / FH 1290) TaxID=566461 RepID=D5ZVR2_STRV1|nr:predicted protein [Streptomyces viridosporus ATCC 14672]
MRSRPPRLPVRLREVSGPRRTGGPEGTGAAFVLLAEPDVGRRGDEAALRNSCPLVIARASR